MVVDGKKCPHWITVTCALCLLQRCDLLKSALPPCEVGTLTVTILLLAGSGSLVVTTFPPTEVPVIWKVCPPDVATVVSVPAPKKANKQTKIYNKYRYYCQSVNITNSNKLRWPRREGWWWRSPNRTNRLKTQSYTWNRKSCEIEKISLSLNSSSYTPL